MNAPVGAGAGRRRLAFRAAVAALLALGVFLRVHGVADHELWIDEYGTWWAVAGDGPGEVAHRVLAVQGQSPLYYLLVRASVAVAGVGPLALRLPSLLCGVLLLVLALPLAQRAFGDRRMVLASLAAFAVNERLVFYSQEARPYALALLCAAASCLAYLALLEDPRRRAARAGYLLATAGAFYAHYLFGMIVLVQALDGLVRRPRTVLPLGPWLGTAGLLGLLWGPGIVHVARLFARRRGLDWLPSAGPREALEVALGYLELPILLATVAATALAVAWGGLRRPLFPAGTRPGLVLLWAGVPFVAIGVLSSLFEVTLVHRRYLLLTVPAFALLNGALMGLARAGRLAWLPVVVFLVAVAGLRLVPQHERSGLFSERYRGEHWSRAAAVLRAEHRPGEPVFYGTSFVELDAVLRGEGAPEAASFSAWPVAAHLRRSQREALRPLPYREGPAAATVLRGRLREAAASPRAWIIGLPPLVPRLARMAAAHPRLEVARHDRHGKVHLVLLRAARAAPSGAREPGG